MTQVVDRGTALLAQRATLVTYLRMKLEANDMHGVQDAASDIREIDARLEGYEEGLSDGVLTEASDLPAPEIIERPTRNPAAVPADDGWKQEE